MTKNISVSLRNKINKQIKRIEDIMDFWLAVGHMNSDSATFIAIKDVLNDLKNLIKDEK